MDKLKQVQKYQFWILLAVALILPLVGWFMTSSEMKAEAAARTAALKSLDGSLAVKADDPNDEWAKQVAAINVDQEKQALIAWQALFERQKPFMVWPKGMPDDPSKFTNTLLEYYREDYVKERERVRKVVNPYDEESESDKGLVQYGEELMPSPNEDWKFQAPSAKEVEAAQEDLWLLTAILGCIASVNEGSTSVYDAPIREIVELLLRGGSPKGSAGAAGGGATKSAVMPATGNAATAGGGASGAAAMMSMAKMMGGGGLSGRQDSSSGGINDVKINLNDDLGPERPAAPKAGDKTSSSLSTSTKSGPPGGNVAAAVPGGPAAAMPAGMKSMLSTQGSSSTSRGGGTNVERYCDDARKEWKTRGFSLEVIMDHRRVPDLLVALSNCPGWPINILRIHVADYKDEDLASGDAGGQVGDKIRTMMPGIGRGPAGGHAGMGVPPKAGALPKSRSVRGLDDDDAPAVNNRLVPGAQNRSPLDASNRSPLEDPNLARVAIVGVLYIFNEPPPAPHTSSPPTTSGPPAAVAETPSGPGSESEAGASADATDAVGDSDQKPETESADEATDETSESPPAAPESKLEPGSKPAPGAGGPPRSSESS